VKSKSGCDVLDPVCFFLRHMERLKRCLLIPGLALLMQACTSPPAPDFTTPGPMARQIVGERLTAVVVTKSPAIDGWAARRFAASGAPGDADGGSAAPISPDGYFLTADHVLAQSRNRSIFVIYGRGGRVVTAKARTVWRSPEDDLAILHVPIPTPYYYHWSEPRKWMPAGTEVIHGGVATGARSAPGKLSSSIPPERLLTGNRPFKIDIPLQPGDSGGPVVDAYGSLVGINSAVEYLVPLETAFFVDSEANRPSVRKIMEIVRKDRARQRNGGL
jgi:S1-C subfamily serine protease